MFLSRGIVITLGSFFVVYAALSFLLAALWHSGSMRRAHLSSRALYALRMSPVAVSFFTAAFFVVPSFIRLEPRIAEGVSTTASWLALAGSAVIVLGLSNMLRSWMAARRYVSAFHGESRPALMVVGICRPRLLISPSASALLEEHELRAAIRHERAHIARCDNLKKLLLGSCAFPMLRSLDQRWLSAVELEADHACATDELSALDLASALLKMARTAPPVEVPRIATALASRDADLSERIERLLDWQCSAVAPPTHVRLQLLAVITAALSLFWSYGSVLVRVHEWTELLIR